MGTSRRHSLAIPLTVIGALAVLSLVCDNPTEPPQAPVLHAMRDTVVAVCDSVRLHASAGGASRYVWIQDGDSGTADTTADTVYTLSWDTADAGMHLVTVKALGANGLASSVDTIGVDVHLYAPRVTAPSDTTTWVHDTLRLTAAGQDTNGTLVAYRWSIGDNPTPYTVSEPHFSHVWTPDEAGPHTVRVAAIDDDGIVSPPESLQVIVFLGVPTLVDTAADTTVAAMDTVRLHAAAIDPNGEIVKFVWSFGGSLPFDTTSEGVYPVIWQAQDTGLHSIAVWAFDDDSIKSEADSFEVTVRLYAPRVAAAPDTVIAINDTLTLHASASDSNGDIRGYIWAIDSAAPTDTTAEGRIDVAWGPLDTGAHLITVRAFDDDGFLSPVDSTTVAVRLYPPTLVAGNDTTVAVYDTCTLHAAAHDTNGQVIAYVWQIDNTPPDTTDSAQRRLRFAPADTGMHTVYVRAFDDDSISTAVDSIRIAVALFAPTLDVPPDTTIPIYDSLCLSVTATDHNGAVIGYVWDLDGNRDSTTSDSACYVFALDDTGTHVLRVTAIDDDSLSVTDSCVITVRRLVPELSLELDTMLLYVNDSAVVRGDASDDNGMVVYCVWRTDGQSVPDTTAACSLTVGWGLAGAGWHTVVAQAVDDDTLLSDPDTVHVYVELAAPVLAPLPDSILSPTDTLQLTVTATDSHGSIVMYYADWGADGWDDSSATGELEIVYGSERIMPVTVAVRDDDGNVAVDTATVFFHNWPPAGLSLVSPSDTVFVWDPDPARSGWPVSFAFAATDPDGPNDSLSYRFALGSDAQSLTVVHDSMSDTATVDSIAPGNIHWRLVVTDTYGDSTAASGMLPCVREVRICFVGHSIVVGAGGDGINGGFRRGVVDSLSSVTGPFERVRVVGPMTSGLLRPPEEDSCMARSSASSYEIYDTLTNYPEVNADYWIMMLGVNGNYHIGEQTYSRIIIDSLHYRNEQGETYFLNGLPIPDTLTLPHPTDEARDYFNTLFDTVISVRRNAGWQVYVVDAFTALSIDSVFNDSLFADHLHPNQRGYERLVGTIWERMRNH
ncbi:MAG: hypothetical protein GF331_26795 [Chitinivibrionales bacterium]|nr:hypothetical protein [Chitinivibrionales bacterium]